MAPDLDQATQLGAEILGSLLLVAVIAGILTFVLLRAASKRADAMVTISLSVLTLVAIVGFIGTGAETLGTLAGAGIGALAGALTNLFGAGSDQQQQQDDGETPEDGSSAPGQMGG